MQTQTPKQYLPLNGIPVLAHTVAVFDACPQIDHILLVIPPGDEDYCRRKIIAAVQPRTGVKLVEGGMERQDSVFNALTTITEKDAMVAIHDGVRPLIETAMIAESLTAARKSGACILALPVTDTVKRVDRAGVIDKTVERKDLWFAQTPQVFRHEIIMAAHLRAQADGYNGSDDALLVERLGLAVKIVQGHKNNLKITTREDIALAEFLLQNRGGADEKGP